jgi:hypothetical protein
MSVQPPGRAYEGSSIKKRHTQSRSSASCAKQASSSLLEPLSPRSLDGWKSARRLARLVQKTVPARTPEVFELDTKISLAEHHTGHVAAINVPFTDNTIAHILRRLTSLEQDPWSILREITVIWYSVVIDEPPNCNSAASYVSRDRSSTALAEADDEIEGTDEPFFGRAGDPENGTPHTTVRTTHGTGFERAQTGLPRSMARRNTRCHGLNGTQRGL